VPLDDVIRAAAERCGVQQEFWDIFGKPHITEPETNRDILSSLGFDCSSETALTASLAQREAEQESRALPPVLVVSVSAPIEIPLTQRTELLIELESGEKRRVWSDEPLQLPLGYHQVTTGSCTMRLIVAPDHAHNLSRLRQAGLGITLWGLRSAHNWGCGDFRDLRALIDWAIQNLHVEFIALNPLHAIHNRAPYNTSPYLPLSVFYRNFLYLDIEGIEGFEPDETARVEIEKLRASETVEYERVAAVKRNALEKIFEAHPPSEACRRWIAAEGHLLHTFATYCALDEFLHAADPNLWIWPDWPAEFRDPHGEAVKEFAGAHANRVLFYGWLQWLIDEQIGAVQKHALESGMSIGLYHDLALATDRCGADLWGYRPFFVNGARVGSPPDGFSPTGQDWSFPPPNQERHLEDGYRLYAESIRKTMRHGGALRIDHVMRLFRLYWIPEGHTAARGAYVKDRAADLVRILALESLRNNSVIIGEDLGTVEDDVRETLERFGILSYRLLIFEADANGFKAPARYPKSALTSTTTHDLPTMAGFWTGQDIEARLRTGTVDRASYESQWRDRLRDKQQLLDALFRADLLPSHYERDASRITELTPELHYAIAGYLAGTPCALWLINQEDITRERYQQNMPGTTSEYPNWSRKMRWSIEELSSVEEAHGCAEMFRYWVRRSGRG